MSDDHLALLRGINVGGKNLVKMAQLREAFADFGAGDVQTYIASGNVLFTATPSTELASGLEAALSAHFELELKVVILTAAQLRRAVDEAPDGFGAEDELCDVVFLRPPLTAERAFALLDPREGIDRAHAGHEVLYHSRLKARASGSRFGRITGLPEYKDMTIRSWKTAHKLRELMDARA